MNTSQFKAVVVGDKAAPGVLAQELAAAREKRDVQVQKASAAYAEKRASVITRGVQRVRDIRKLRGELDTEEDQLQAVVGKVE